MSFLGRIVLIAAVTSALAALAVQVAGADDGLRPLTGEEFLVQDVTLTFDCDSSRVSTVTFSASGIATGPYAGPFTVEGTLTIAPQTLPGPRPGTVAGPLLSLSETFTVDSPLGSVSGVKKLPHGLPFETSQGSCQHVTDFAVGNVTAAEGTVVDVFSQPRYAARIREPGLMFHDRGDAQFSLSELDLNGTCPTGPCHFRQGAFDQFFRSTRPQRDENNDDIDDDMEAELATR